MDDESQERGVAGVDAKLREALEESRWLHKPMQAGWGDCAEERWRGKPVAEERRVAEEVLRDGATLQGPGGLRFVECGGHAGEGALEMDFPLEATVINPSFRAYSMSELFLPFAREDMRRYNRVSFWVYVYSDGCPATYLTLSLHNEGEKAMPAPGRFEGWHSLSPAPGEWRRHVWEIPYVYRDCVTALSLCAYAVGAPYPVETRARLRVADVRWEVVEEDTYKGFALRPGGIAYCHAGYAAGAAKVALVGAADSDGGAASSDGSAPLKFSLVDGDGREVFAGVAAPLGDGACALDFSAFDEPGWYELRGPGALRSGRFPIGGEAYESAAWKALNFFFAERCGFSVPGAHAECHVDVMSAHPDGRRKSVAGGWHDAADLTQDTRNSADVVLAILELAAAAKGRRMGALYGRCLEEARWGLDWLAKTRWGDGYRHCGAIVGFWTHNAVGDFDDIQAAARNEPYTNFLCAAAFACGAAMLRGEDPFYARMCEAYAREDYAFAVDRMYAPPATSSNAVCELELCARAALTAAELADAFGGPVDGRAAAWARAVLACQEREAPPSFDVPLRGYFYEDASKKRVKTYFHRSYEHVPPLALARLLAAAPDHGDAPLWCEGLALYAEYLKTASDPAVARNQFGIFPAGVYEVGNTDYSGLYHEGDRSVGAPTMEEYNAQVRNGVRLDGTRFLRRFPVAYQFRGFHATLLAQGIGAFAAAGALGDRALRDAATRQAEWVLGRNPFCCSGMFGEGYDYHPLYSALEPQIVGAVPVGFETFENEDEPFYPMQNLPTYKEIWVHSNARFMRLAANILAGVSADECAKSG